MNRIPHVKSCLIAALLAVGLLGPARAQNALEQQPGYVDFGNLERVFTDEPTLEVNIKGPLLLLAAEATREEDPQLAQMLRKLQGVFVRGYDIRNQTLAALEEQAVALARRLERDGWETVVRVREDDERVQVYLRTDGKTISGMTVLVIDPTEDEAVFVNIVGDIDPAEIGRLGRKFGVPRLEDL